MTSLDLGGCGAVHALIHSNLNNSALDFHNYFRVSREDKKCFFSWGGWRGPHVACRLNQKSNGNFAVSEINFYRCQPAGLTPIVPVVQKP